MKFVTIIFNEIETVIPESDLDWFVKEKGAKVIKEKVVASSKKSDKKNNK